MESQQYVLAIAGTFWELAWKVSLAAASVVALCGNVNNDVRVELNQILICQAAFADWVVAGVAQAGQ